MPVDPARRKKWISAGYPEGMGSAIITEPPPNEYIRAYYLTSADYAISNIALERIKVARFSDLNDPFELMAVNLRERRTRKITRNFKDAYNSRTGLLCFSTNWTNPVLWSHYGDKHRGICLGVDVKIDQIQRIKYEDDRIRKKLTSEDPTSLDDNLQKLLLCTKYSHWQYEQEIRIFVPLKTARKEGNLYFLPFKKDFQLAEVILGPQCNLDIKSVRTLVKSRHSKAITFKARLAYGNFTVVANRKSVL